MKPGSDSVQRYNNVHFRTLLSALVFTFLIYTLEEILFGKPQINYYNLSATVAGHIPTAETFYSYLTIILSFYLTLLFFWGAVASPYWLRAIYVFFFTATSLIEYGAWFTVQRYMIAADIYLGLKSPLSLWATAGGQFLDIKAGIPIIGFLALLWIIRPSRDWRWGTGLFAVIIIALAGLNAIPNKPFYGLDWGSSPIQMANSLYQFGSSLLKQKTDREEVNYQSHSAPQNNIVLIVDESLRADHLSINGYNRPTTPYLEQLAQNTDIFHNWGSIVPGATCSSMSNTILLTGAQVSQQNIDEYNRYPTVLQYAKAAGYKTHYFDAQTSILWNGLNDSDIAYIDNWVTAVDLKNDNLISDFLASEQVREILASSTGNFILVNKRGMHFLYETNYPQGTEVWKPTFQLSEIDYKRYSEEVVNAYDNAIYFNVNKFFETLIPNPNALASYTHNTFYIYTSDHAETLFEDGATSPHCRATRQEARVPLIIIGNLPKQVDTAYRASHSNILPTILDLMNIPAEERNYAYALSLLDAKESDSRDRLFYDGLTGLVYNYDALERAASEK